MIFTESLTALPSQAQASCRPQAAVLKDSLILGASSYSCEVKLRDDKESNVVRARRYFLGRQPQRPFAVMYCRHHQRQHRSLHFLRRPGRPTPTWCTPLGLAPYGVANNILNFGPYQYVVTIPAQGDWSSHQLIISSKLTFTINSPVTASFSALRPRPLTSAHSWPTLSDDYILISKTLPPRISNHIILRSQIVHREMPTECAKHVKVD
jgi:hypothetical protein